MTDLSGYTEELTDSFTQLLLEPLTSVAEANHRFVQKQRTLEDERNTVDSTVYVSKINPDQVLSVRDYTLLGSNILYVVKPRSGHDHYHSNELDFMQASDRAFAEGSVLVTLENRDDIGQLLRCGPKEYCFDSRVLRVLKSTDYSHPSTFRHSMYDKITQPSSHLLIDKCRYKLNVFLHQGVYQVQQSKLVSRQCIEMEVECVSRSADVGNACAQEKLAETLLQHNKSLVVVADSTLSSASKIGVVATRRACKTKETILRVASLLYDPRDVATVAERRMYDATAQYIHTVCDTDTSRFTDTAIFVQVINRIVSEILPSSMQLFADMLEGDDKLSTAGREFCQLAVDGFTIDLLTLGCDWGDLRLFASIDTAMSAFDDGFRASMASYFGASTGCSTFAEHCTASFVDERSRVSTD